MTYPETHYPEFFQERDSDGTPLPSTEQMRQYVDGQMSEGEKQHMAGIIDLSGEATKMLSRALRQKEMQPHDFR